MPRLARHALVSLLAGASTPSLALADASINTLSGSEFGRGIGVGVEAGGADVLVFGVGVAFNPGWSSIDGLEGSVSPGVAAGYRRYFGGWFVGPSVGINYNLLATTAAVVQEGTFTASALLDGGRRWTVGAGDRWNARLGLGIGVSGWSAEDLGPMVALTLGFGWKP